MKNIFMPINKEKRVVTKPIQPKVIPQSKPNSLRSLIHGKITPGGGCGCGH